MPPRDVRTRLARRASKLNLFLPDEVAVRLTAYYELLQRWNRKINLTSIVDVDEGIDRLLLEPLVAARHFPAGSRRLMDIGSGGGSPAIPFKLLNPAMQLTMVEVKARKSAFLREAVRQLSLERVTVENARFEELLTRPDLHETQDIVSLRAVRTESRVLDIAAGLCRGWRRSAALSRTGWPGNARVGRSSSRMGRNLSPR